MTTTTQVALLRGINVGRSKRIPMGRLRQLLGELGYADVRTHLQSGNAIITSGRRPDRVAREIARAIEHEFGFDVDVVVRTKDELDAVIEGNPMPEHTDQPAKLLVAGTNGRSPRPSRRWRRTRPRPSGRHRHPVTRKDDWAHTFAAVSALEWV